MMSLPIAVQCGDVLWSGIFNSSASVADFDECMLLLDFYRLILISDARVLVKPNRTLAVVHPRHW